MANRFSSQRLTVISFLHRACRTPRQVPAETPAVPEENVTEDLPVSVVTVANRHWEIVSR
jgi:hypothetical protein